MTADVLPFPRVHQPRPDDDAPPRVEDVPPFDYRLVLYSPTVLHETKKAGRLDKLFVLVWEEDYVHIAVAFEQPSGEVTLVAQYGEQYAADSSGRKIGALMLAWLRAVAQAASAASE